MDHYAESIELGVIEHLSLKEVWPLEEKHFTPWLAKNLDHLSNSVGIDMELIDTELRAGDGHRHVDMLVEMHGGNLAIIENQYGKANPDHGWRTLHYAVSLGAKVAFWIFEDISSDDERLISFLNGHPDISVIGIQAKVFRIGESLPAVDFSVIPASQESLESIQRISYSSRESSEKEYFYGDFFPGLIHFLSENGFSGGKHGHRQGHWDYHWPSPYSGLNKIEAAFRQSSTKNKSYRVQLKIDDKNAKTASENFQYLKSHSTALTQGISTSFNIVYNYKQGRKMQFIELYFNDSVDIHQLNSNDIEELYDWSFRVIPQLYSNLMVLRQRQVKSNLKVMGQTT